MLKILHVVRRYGPVGGMERYVWELTHALADLDIEIHIICEETFRVTAHNNIHIHTLGALPPRPRWLSMLRFSHRVTKWVKDNANKNFIIHSHERTNVHHITTFHSAVFANIRQKPWWKRISIRIAIWLYLEKRELSGKQVQIILPNSDAIKEELSNAYPKTQKALHNPAYPGSHSTPPKYQKTQHIKRYENNNFYWSRMAKERTKKSHPNYQRTQKNNSQTRTLGIRTQSSRY